MLKVSGGYCEARELGNYCYIAEQISHGGVAVWRSQRGATGAMPPPPLLVTGFFAVLRCYVLLVCK